MQSCILFTVSAVCQNSFAIFYTHHRGLASVTFCHYRKKKKKLKQKATKRQFQHSHFESEQL